ncbi:serine hydrolase domain-containing protein [Winogradskyella sp.]|uniref:serine hydrolase domain-containing protein n=1 Tax=Winogradskyella sp. TaxID=1883156 RepID=UPI002610CE55|nr:serine hydrolase domain-containing protein [Winogradskyella sp.]
MRNTALNVIALLFLVSCTSCKEYNNASGTTSKLDSILNVLHQKEQFNGGVLIAKGNEVIYKNTFGYSTFEDKKALNLNTVFQTASVSKTFTAVAVLQLIEQGRLQLDDKLVDFFPELPYPDVTIRNLLSHTSGLYPYNPLFVKHWDHNKIAENKDILTIYREQKPKSFFSPDEGYSYSNIGYVFLACIVENVSKVSFQDYLKQEIFGPLKMENSQIYTLLNKNRIENFAKEHLLDPISGAYKSPLELDYQKEVYYLSGKVGDDKVASTLDDLWKWNRALFTHKILPKGKLEKVFASSITHIPDSLRHSPFDYGLGFQLEHHEDFGKIIYHNGGEPGLRARFLYYSDHDVSLIMYDNAHSQYINKVRDIIIGTLLDKEIVFPKKSLATELYKVARYGNDEVHKTIEKYKDSPSYYLKENEINRLAGVFWTAEDYENGLTILRLNTELFPESINAQFYLGEGYMENGDMEKAKKHFQISKDIMLARPKEKQNANYLKYLDQLLNAKEQ